MKVEIFIEDNSVYYIGENNAKQYLCLTPNCAF